MIRLNGFWDAFKNWALLLSFIVNLTLIIVILIIVQQIFAIKSGILEPLVTGLHSSFVGLDEARIITNIVVKDEIPVRLNIPLQQDTTVVLTEAVPLNVPAAFTLGDGTTLRGRVNITLPVDLALPVRLNLNVPVDQPLPITLNVPVDIPLQDTQLHDVADRLRGIFDPLVRLVGNLPNNWNEAGQLALNVIRGTPPDFWRDNKYTIDPWPGFRTGNPPADPSQAGTDGTNTDPNAPPAAATDPVTGQLYPTPELTFPTLPPDQTPSGQNPPGQVTPSVFITPTPGNGNGATTAAPTSVPPTTAPPTAIPPTNTPAPTATPVEDYGIITPTP